jgi:hypothetical protein
MSPKQRTKQLATNGYRWVSLPPYMRGGTTFQENKYGALRHQTLWGTWQEAVKAVTRANREPANLEKSF